MTAEKEHQDHPKAHKAKHTKPHKPKLKSAKDLPKVAWYYLAKDEGPIGWIVSVVVAFVLIKYLLLPGLGYLLGTSFPLVAVVSGSMEHHGSFDSWWDRTCAIQGTEFSKNVDFYTNQGISKEQFEDFRFSNGMNTGDLIIIQGPEDIMIGDVIVFNAGTKYDPIIHRVIGIKEQDGNKFYITKGDDNCKSAPFEENTPQSKVLGKGLARVPFLGYVKKYFEDLLRWLGLNSIIAYFR